MNKIAGLARALAILLAIVAAFVAMPGLDVALAIVALSLVAGLGETREGLPNLILLVLVLTAVGEAVGHIPGIGAQLTAVAANVRLGASAAIATQVAIMLFNTVKGDLMGLGSKAE